MKFPSRPPVRRTFHFFDYLWWTGERLSRYTKADGVLAVWSFFIPALFPLLALCSNFHLTSGATAALMFAVYLLILPLAIHRFYPKPRRQAVMRHYSKRPFRRLPSTVLCLLPYMLLLVEDSLVADHRHRAEIEKEQQALTVDRELQKYIKRKTSRATSPFPELNLLSAHPDLERLGLPEEMQIIDSTCSIHEFQIELLNKYQEEDIFAGKHRFLQATWRSSHPDTLLTIWYEIHPAGLKAVDSCRHHADAEF